jgi:hypothetical protein
LLRDYQNVGYVSELHVLELNIHQFSTPPIEVVRAGRPGGF